ncbi:long-chain fatty acid--CoA ligase [Phreatobacter aquaticus]|uniref:Long-chain fatty acid--CoA ligase n=1 Tax=Phreatobacter aquaticus TaxID=2570229 RepID=A0A4D7QEK5_9HYPH|nr:acyl-CoA synthetase [Phreatobacter aquaticus]QCK85598.1 long-chain fatty acid--CoA ligase [Phreatobacter aquaticus]
MALSTGIVSGSRAASQAEVETRSRHIAGGLKALGVGAGDCVAILMRNDIAFLEATYAAMMLGAYAVPVNWHFKAEEIAYVLRDCGAKALIGHLDLVNHYVAAVPDGLTVVTVVPPPEIQAVYPASGDLLRPAPGAVDIETWLAAVPPYDGPALPAPQSMIYTSGTTGNPKGVRRQAPTPEEARATDALRALVYGIRPGLRALLPGPLYHSAPNSYGTRCGKLGAALVLMPRFDPEEMLRLIEAERIEGIFMVPTMFIRLLKLPEAVRRRYDCSSLKFVIHAAAPCPVDVKAAMIAWWGPVIHEFYGGTETGPVTYATSEDALKKPGTVGRLSPGAEILVVDDAGQPVPQGGVGEIYARIAGYPDFTYHNNPQKRREVDLQGFVTCGDIGYVDPEGYVFLCDRKRDMVISGGVNIYPAEIEAVLHGLPGVQDCAVFGVPDAEFGEALMAVVEPQPGMVIDPVAIRAGLSEKLAGYKVPRHVEIRTGLPREDSGKIFKRRLRDPYWEAAGRKI